MFGAGMRGQYWGMKARHVVCLLGSAATVSGLCGVVPASSVPVGSAQPFPDVEVIFARGTGEPAGVGPTGQAFVDSLGSRIGGNSVDVYPVSYQASQEWATGVDGIRDAAAHVQSTAASCPQTQMVLGGYSQGAAVIGFVTSAAVPEGVDPATVPKPLAAETAKHVSAVVLYGMPNVRAMNFLGEPRIVIGPTDAKPTLLVPVAALIRVGMHQQLP